ncbi:hypothetical protein ACTWP6_19065 [Mycobacterium sp. 4D054]|uniref:hypothetical protein n=1 Tax=Mycobacterium sp. 4D054 TaxID=3457440 RepID=UPI003FD319C4
MDAGGGGRSSNELPWAAVFDSAANLRALSAIQADGFRAASELVDRFVRMASAGIGAYGQPAQPVTPSGGHDQTDLFGATGLEPFVASWWAMVDQFLKLPVQQREQPSAPAEPTLDLATATASGCVQLTAAPTGVATAELWLRNSGSVDLGKIRLRCGGLLADHGGTIGSEVAGFEPEIVPMPGRSSRGITVQFELPRHTAAGTYRGMILVDGHPGVWLPLVLVLGQGAS